MGLSAGTHLGPYEILSQLGAGGMGEVYKARDTRLQRDVAIKILPAAFAADPDRLHRFQQEARAIAILNHPHICHLYDIGPDYLVMEYIEGQQLCCPLPPDDALRLSMQIGAALQEAHSRAHSPPRSEAGQYHGQRERRSEAARLRPGKIRECRGGRHPVDIRRNVGWHHRLHVARTGRRT